MAHQDNHSSVPRPRGRRLSTLLAGSALLGLVTGSYFLWSHYLGPNTFEEERFNLIVAKVRASVTTPGEVQRFGVNADLDPASLRTMPPEESSPRGAGRGLIRAWLGDDAKLMLLLKTRDQGHAGEEGYLYWDGDPLPNFEAVASDWIVRKQVAPHWWSVYFNLG